MKASLSVTFPSDPWETLLESNPLFLPFPLAMGSPPTPAPPHFPFLVAAENSALGASSSKSKSNTTSPLCTQRKTSLLAQQTPQKTTLVVSPWGERRVAELAPLSPLGDRRVHCVQSPATLNPRNSESTTPLKPQTKTQGGETTPRPGRASPKSLCSTFTPLPLSLAPQAENGAPNFWTPSIHSSSKDPDTWLAEAPQRLGATPGGLRYEPWIRFRGKVLMGTFRRRSGLASLRSCGLDSQSASTFQLPGMCCTMILLTDTVLFASHGQLSAQPVDHWRRG